MKTKETITSEFIKNCTIDLDNTGQQKYTFTQKQMDGFIDGVSDGSNQRELLINAFYYKDGVDSCNKVSNEDIANEYIDGAKMMRNQGCSKSYIKDYAKNVDKLKLDIEKIAGVELLLPQIIKIKYLCGKIENNR